MFKILDMNEAFKNQVNSFEACKINSARYLLKKKKAFYKM